MCNEAEKDACNHSGTLRIVTFVCTLQGYVPLCKMALSYLMNKVPTDDTSSLSSAWCWSLGPLQVTCVI